MLGKPWETHFRTNSNRPVQTWWWIHAYKYSAWPKPRRAMMGPILRKWCLQDIRSHSKTLQMVCHGLPWFVWKLGSPKSVALSSLALLSGHNWGYIAHFQTEWSDMFCFSRHQEVRDWTATLSAGERQRLAFARLFMMLAAGTSDGVPRSPWQYPCIPVSSCYIVLQPSIRLNLSISTCFNGQYSFPSAKALRSRCEERRRPHQHHGKVKTAVFTELARCSNLRKSKGCTCLVKTSVLGHRNGWKK